MWSMALRWDAQNRHIDLRVKIWLVWLVCVTEPAIKSNFHWCNNLKQCCCHATEIDECTESVLLISSSTSSQQCYDAIIWRKPVLVSCLQRWVHWYLVRTSGATKPVFKLGPIEAVWKGSVSIVLRTQGVILLSTREPCVLSELYCFFLGFGNLSCVAVSPSVQCAQCTVKSFFCIGDLSQWHILHCTVCFCIGHLECLCTSAQYARLFYIGDSGCHSVTEPIVQ